MCFLRFLPLGRHAESTRYIIPLQQQRIFFSSNSHPKSLSLNNKHYERIDTKCYHRFGTEFNVKNLSIEGARTWDGKSMVQKYEVYHKTGFNEILCLIQFGDAAGRPGIIHGGITSLVLDNSFGWLYIALNNSPPAVTANLNINFRKPIYTQSFTTLQLNLVEILKDRKVYMKAIMKNEEEEILVEATSLFVVPKILP